MARQLKTIASLITERSNGRYVTRLTENYSTVGRKTGRIFVSGPSTQKTTRLEVTDTTTNQQVLAVETGPGRAAGRWAEGWMNDNGLMSADELSPRPASLSRRRR